MHRIVQVMATLMEEFDDTEFQLFCSVVVSLHHPPAMSLTWWNQSHQTAKMRHPVIKGIVPSARTFLFIWSYKKVEVVQIIPDSPVPQTVEGCSEVVRLQELLLGSAWTNVSSSMEVGSRTVFNSALSSRKSTLLRHLLWMRHPKVCESAQMNKLCTHQFLRRLSPRAMVPSGALNMVSNKSQQSPFRKVMTSKTTQDQKQSVKQEIDDLLPRYRGLSTSETCAALFHDLSNIDVSKVAMLLKISVNASSKNTLKKATELRIRINHEAMVP